ncbi:sulfotransferase 1B1-like [Haliotis rufescens]|uniref:sulfotransferase 1B1-like n=1 Tax=Haliotis rufescens TaxID=6454 RepID=UPI00201ECFB7|nr:sulfotransferase 1B1-like [Haliotis rufescens]
MPLIQIKDSEGYGLMFREVGKNRIPKDFPEDVIREVPKLAMREDDIVITNWMRSGTHWMFEMISMLINNNTETIPKKKEDHMLEYQPISMLDALPSPRVLNTHLHFQYLPEDMKTKRCKVVYLLRDPRDAHVSYYKLLIKGSITGYEGGWKNWFALSLNGELSWGAWIDHVRDWEKVFEEYPNLDVHFWHYEDMKKSPLEELRKVSKFLGSNSTEELLQAIIDKCQLERMRCDKFQYEWLENGQSIHYEKGVVGTWKEVFTVEQYEQFEKLYRRKMAGSKFESRYRGPVDVL